MRLSASTKYVTSMRPGDSVGGAQVTRAYTLQPIRVTLAGLRTVNGSNSREHWAVKAKRAKRERTAGRVAWQGPLPQPPVLVTLTRLGPFRRPLDSDGLAISLKHVRDGIADAFGLDDGGSWAAWFYKQERAPEYGVQIDISSVTEVKPKARAAK